MKNKRHLCLCAAAAAAGILLSERRGVIWLPAAVMIAAVILHSLRTYIFDPDLKEADKITSKRRRAAAAIPIAAIFLLSFFRCQYQSYTYQNFLDIVPDNKTIELSGTIIQKEAKSESYLYYLKNTYFELDGVTYYAGRVIVYYESDEAATGSLVCISGDARGFDHEENEGGFDSADYYRNKNISFSVYADDMSVSRRRLFSFRELLYDLQQQMTEVFESETGNTNAGILCALVLGNKALLNEDIRDLYQEGGISHILAISGLHISILGLGVFRLLRLLKRPYPVSAALSMASVTSFAVMSGLGISSRRALIMYAVLMGSELTGRTYDSANAVSLAAIIILLYNPLSLFQTGFQLSFTAMSAIALSLAFRGRDLRQRITTRGPALPVWLEKALLNLWGNLKNSIWLQLWMMPLMAFIFYEVPLYALFVNLIVLPFSGILLGLGLTGGLTGLIFPRISKLILIPVCLILDIFEWLLEAVQLLPGSSIITGRPDERIIAAYYIMLAAAFLLYKKNKKGISGYSFENQRKKKKSLPLGKDMAYGFVKGGKYASRVAYSVCAFLLFIIIAAPAAGETRIDFLCVGQGDGIFISDGSGTNIFIDGGSSSEDEAGRYIIEPFLKYNRIRSIDAWIVTHPDDDHISGLIELMEGGYQIDCLIISEASEDNEAYSELYSTANLYGISILYVNAGDMLNLSDVTMECLYPLAGTDESEDTNDLSQVWLFSCGAMNVLFTGDISSDQEDLLLERGLLSDITVLKAAHHGSKYSTSEEFLNAVKPEYTIISCGENNLYGHPHEDTLDRLEAIGSEVYITWKRGQVSLKKKADNWVIEFPCG